MTSLSGATNTSPSLPQREAKYFAGWNMVAAGFVVNFISVGFFFYSYGVFLKVLSDDFNASRFEIAMGLTITNVIGSLLAPAMGRAIDHYPLKRTMTLGTCSVVTGFIALSFAQNLWQFYLAIALFLALGSSAMGGQSSSKLVANWFINKRGTALGVTTMGISLAGILMPPVTTWLVDSLGWRSTFLAFAVLTFFVVLPIVRIIIIDTPETIGLLPDGIKKTPTHQNASSLHTVSFSTREILSSFKFWNLVIILGILHGTLGTILTHLIAFATDSGISTYEAASYLSLSAMIGIFSKVLFGWLSDHVDMRIPVLLIIIFMASGITMLSLNPDSTIMALAIIIFGFGCGGVVPIKGAIVGKAYGRDQFASVSGLLRLFMLPLVILGSPLAGWIFDTTGSYLLAFQILIAGLIIGGFFTLLMNLGDPDKHADI